MIQHTFWPPFSRIPFRTAPFDLVPPFKLLSTYSTMASEEYDLIIMGGGQSGIVAARFYLDVHPHCRVVIVERDRGIGGVWSRGKPYIILALSPKTRLTGGSERIYKGFRAQAGYTTAGFSDMPFNPPQEQVDQYKFFDAAAMTDYLERYVDEHVYDGRTLRDRILFNTSVKQIEKKLDGSCVVSCNNPGGEIVLKAPKVIVATGMTSEAVMPKIPGQDKFKGQIVHTLDWERSKVLNDPNVKDVVVLGGAK